jgi:DNA-binding GntR family transcriptional regulator
MADESASSGAPWATMPKRNLVTDETYQILRDALITHRLKPGQRLNIEQLAADLNVSITPIRHALVQLAADGFVTREPYKGYVASALLDARAVADFFDTRLLLETEMAARAAQKANAAEHAELAGLAKLDPFAPFTDAQSGDDTDVTLNCDAQLHRRIAEIAGNLAVRGMLDDMNRRMLAYRLFRIGPSGPERERYAAATKREHSAVVRAIRNQDSEAARAAMRAHLNNAIKRGVDDDPADG